VLLTRAGEGGAFVLQRLSRLLDFGLQTRNRFALARQRAFQILGLAASCAGRLTFVLERRAKAIELRPQLRGAFAFGVERGRGAIEVAAQPAGDRFAFRDPRALLREGVLQLLDPATGGGARLALFVERTPDVVGLLTQTRNRGPFLFELASGLLDLEPGGVDVGFEHGATCALAFQRVLQLLELTAGRGGGRASLFEHLPIVVRLGAQL
jgi:hypothetical protein